MFAFAKTLALYFPRAACFPMKFRWELRGIKKDGRKEENRALREPAERTPSRWARKSRVIFFSLSTLENARVCSAMLHGQLFTRRCSHRASVYTCIHRYAWIESACRLSRRNRAKVQNCRRVRVSPLDISTFCINQRRDLKFHFHRYRCWLYGLQGLGI